MRAFLKCKPSCSQFELGSTGSFSMIITIVPPAFLQTEIPKYCPYGNIYLLKEMFYAISILIGWLILFYGISTFLGHLTPN